MPEKALLKSLLKLIYPQYPIGARFSELEKNGVITGSTIQINQRSLGCSAFCSIQITVDKKEIDPVINYIKKISQEIQFIFRNPKNNIVLIVGCRELDELSNLKEEIVVASIRFLCDYSLKKQYKPVLLHPMTA